jgi:hypothetical protein
MVKLVKKITARLWERFAIAREPTDGIAYVEPPLPLRECEDASCVKVVTLLRCGPSDKRVLKLCNERPGSVGRGPVWHLAEVRSVGYEGRLRFQSKPRQNCGGWICTFAP